MTDHELLELAAKAAGIEYYAIADEGLLCRNASSSSIWNPITDRADSLLLAVELDISITQYPIYEYPKHSVLARVPSLENLDTEVVEPHGTDKAAATCRAIVRAAAEIGKSL